MSGDQRKSFDASRPDPSDGPDASRLRAPRAAGAPPSHDTQVAVEVRSLVESGDMDGARERFGELVALHQRRASRIAYQYLRDAADADEAVQDAFLKVFTHITSYREAWPFEVWFTRILINGCLDRRKARNRRARWFIPGEVSSGDEARLAAASPADPEQKLLARERRSRVAAAVERLDGRQRTVFILSQYGDCTPREISAMTGLKESTVRVHLFRAARKLRGLLGGKP
jgi:RNA polymerase sigma-70 factor, ECF subfamily